MTTHTDLEPGPGGEEVVPWWSAWRLLIIGGVAIVIMAVIILIMLASSSDVAGPEERVNVLAVSSNDCVSCHRNATPGIVEQYGHSTMAVANVACEDCHEVDAEYAGAAEHEGTWVLGTPTTAMCEQCHPAEVNEYYASRHALPAYVAMTGTEPLSAELLTQYEAIPEGGFAPDKERNAIFALEGPAMTRFTCEGCHNIGKPAADGSVGDVGLLDPRDVDRMLPPGPGDLLSPVRRPRPPRRKTKIKIFYISVSTRYPNSLPGEIHECR